jgi:ribosomal protein S12 methylthiotransferase accessory factor
MTHWSRPGAIDLTALRRRYPFAELVRPRVGLMEGATFLPQEIGSPLFEVASTSLGNLTMTFPHVHGINGSDVRSRRLGGAGADLDPETAWVRAVVEGAERYASMVYQPDDFIVATADELGSRAIDLDTIPRCSEREYANPKNPIQPPSKNRLIRWVRGYSLVGGQEKLVPAIMTHLYISAGPAENFWLPISTGVAAHTRLETALISAICESIERDAIALAWLARLPLPQIDIFYPAPERLALLLERLNASAITQKFFDATTNVGVPTVFSVQICDGHPSCSLFVSCATSLDPVVACGKAIREAAPGRKVMVKDRPIPASVEEFQEITHGADYYGRGGHESDFDFLLKGEGRTSLNAMRTELPANASEGQALGFLIDRLRSLGMEAVAVDLTTDELRDCGLWVVRVIIPQLVPISFVHRARYLGTQRIYEQARRFGIRNLNAETVNPGPMPFA